MTNNQIKRFDTCLFSTKSAVIDENQSPVFVHACKKIEHRIRAENLTGFDCESVILKSLDVCESCYYYIQRIQKRFSTCRYSNYPVPDNNHPSCNNPGHKWLSGIPENSGAMKISNTKYCKDCPYYEPN